MSYGSSMRCSVVVLPLLGLFLLPLQAGGTTWTVHADGTGDLPTLQEAIDAAASGDTILVGPGAYQGPFWIETKNVVLHSIAGPEETILYGVPLPAGETDPVVHFFFEEHPGSEIEGFTITQGGSGIWCSASSPIIRSNVIRENYSPLGGGICVLFGGAPLIEGNLIHHNGAVFNCCIPSRGGGIYADESSPVTIRSNVIAYNRCVGSCIGGGISAFVGTIEGNTIFGNHSDGPGGGVELPGDGISLLRNIIAGNRSKEFADGIMVERTAFLVCNDVWANGSEDYWGTEPGEGDFSADPRFCGLPAVEGSHSPTFPADRFDLREDSPCRPGQHPYGYECGLIGGRSGVCGREEEIPFALEPRPHLGLQVLPNPTHGAVLVRTVPGRLGSGGGVLEVIDTSGRVIRRVASLSAGQFYWDGLADDGRPVASGIYFARIQTPGSAPRAGTILVVR